MMTKKHEKHEGLCWETNDGGKLYLDLTENAWAYENDSRQICIIPWEHTTKGCLTQICIREEGEEDIFSIEILEKKFDKELSFHEIPDETADKLMEFIGILSVMEINVIDDFIKFVQKLPEFKAIHVYYKNFSFGIRKVWRGLKVIKNIPPKAKVVN